MTRTAILASIYPHEQEGMLHCAQIVRAAAGVVGGDTDPQARAMLVWAQAVDDVLERIEQKDTVQ